MTEILRWLVLPAAYLIGGQSAGYWLVRQRAGVDVRTQGSGATGATNAARVLGRKGFIAVLVLDASKGAVAAGLALLAGFSDGWQFAAAVAVVAGHVWPVQLGFRGGRGMAPLLGAWLVLAPLAILACLAVAGIIWVFTRRKVGAGLFGAFLLPATTWWVTGTAVSAGLTAIVFPIVMYSHRSHWLSKPPAQHPV